MSYNKLCFYANSTILCQIWNENYKRQYKRQRKDHPMRNLLLLHSHMSMNEFIFLNYEKLFMKDTKIYEKMKNIFHIRFSLFVIKTFNLRKLSSSFCNLWIYFFWQIFKIQIEKWINNRTKMKSVGKSGKRQRKMHRER